MTWATKFDEEAPVWLYVMVRGTGTMACGPMSYKLATQCINKWKEYAALVIDNSEDREEMGNKRFGYDFYTLNGTETVTQSCCFVKDIAGLYVTYIDTSRDEMIKKQKELFDKANRQMDDLDKGEEWKRKGEDE